MNSFSSSFKKIWGLFTAKEKKWFLLLLLMMLIGTILETISVGAVMPAIALIADPDFIENYPLIKPVLVFFNLHETSQIITWGATMLAIVFIFKAAYLGLLLWCQIKFAFKLQANLSKRLFNIYLTQPYPFYLQKNSAELINNITSEISLFTFQGILPLMTLILECFVLIGVALLIFKIEPIGAILIFLVSGSIAFTFYFFTRRKVTKWGFIRQENDAYRLQHLQQGLGAIKEIKLYGREQNFIDKFSSHSEISARIGHLHNVMQQYPRQWLELLAVLSIILLILIMIGQGKNLTTVIPVIGLFAMAAFRLMPSIVRILASMQSMRYGLTVIDLLDREIGSSSINTHEIVPNVVRVDFVEKIELSNVHYSYPQTKKKVLNGVSLTIKKGTTVGVVGASGAGKSTLVDILLGFFQPCAGNITVDNRSIFDNLDGWQKKIGYVPQSIYLIDDSIRRNVALGLSDDEIDDDQVWNCLKAAQLYELVNSYPEGLEAKVGERGIKLSGGQRQRIGIARALYADPALLVLDESTSSLDFKTAQEVMLAINGLHGKKTILIISHQAELMAGCDEVYKISSGSLELLKKKF